MIFILLIFSLIADQVSGQVALIPKFEAGQLGKGWTIGNHREQRNTRLKDIHLQIFQWKISTRVTSTPNVNFGIMVC